MRNYSFPKFKKTIKSFYCPVLREIFCVLFKHIAYYQESITAFALVCPVPVAAAPALLLVLFVF